MAVSCKKKTQSLEHKTGKFDPHCMRWLEGKADTVETVAQVAAQTDELSTAVDTRVRVCVKITRTLADMRTAGIQLTTPLRHVDSTLDQVARYAQAREKLRVLAWIDDSLKQGASLTHKLAKGITPPVPPKARHLHRFARPEVAAMDAKMAERQGPCRANSDTFPRSI